VSYKYTLIISQFFHSRHMFIVKHDEKFLINAKKCTEELIKYKRDENYPRTEMYLGDLDPKFCKPDEIKPRYNINDRGDIYFIQSEYANYCKDVAIEYHEHSLRESKGYQRKAVTEAISKYHDYLKFKEIVERYFEIA
jgi:hypothetical protein